MVSILPIEIKYDLDRLLYVIKESFLTVANAFDLSEKNAPTNPAFLKMDSLKKSINDHVDFYTAKEGNDIVGCVGIQPGKAEGEYYIERLAVLPSRRHNHIGTELLEYAVNEIKKRGGKTVSIGIINENTILKEWYEAFGFQTSDIKAFSHLPFTVCLMKIELKSRPKQGQALKRNLCLIAAFITFLFLGLSASARAGAEPTSPILNNGTKWRIGYYEGGPYSDYTDTMRTLVKGLIELKWLQEKQPPELFGEMKKPYLSWLSQCNSPFLSFDARDSYSADWDDQKRAQIRNVLLKKLQEGTLDLVIAMGTWAGQDLANDAHRVPVLVLSTSDPVSAGIIKSADNSGHDHVTARVDLNRYFRQLRMFHRIVRFNTLGIAYENTPDGRIYSAIRQARQIARERGFRLILCEVNDTTSDTRKSDQSCIECYQKLSQTADAIYVTALTCIDRQLPAVVDIFRAARVPSFSLLGSKFVKKGIMLSISSDSGYAALGRYNAMKFGAILNGVKPIELKQIFEDPPDIAVNMETIRQIGFKMPRSILHIATEIYEE